MLGHFPGMTALMAFVPFRLEYHFFKAFRAHHTRASTHIAALEAVVEPTVFVYIKKDVTTATRATFGFPFRHPGHSTFNIKFRWDYQI